VRLVRFLVTAAFALSLFGCGHPATERECNEIVERITVLELGDASPETVKQEVAVTQDAMKREAHKRCVGRRITDAAMACVRSATKAKQIEEECFR
jgi:hypothetical protein